MTTRGRVTAALSAISLAAGLAITARSPEAGQAWRLAFVILAVGGSGGLMWLLRRWSPSMRELIGLATALRLVVFPLDPTLSDDGYRYVWDGLVQSELDLSPYSHRPSELAASGFDGGGLYEHLNSPDYYSVYPPVSQGVFAAAAEIAGGDAGKTWLLIKSVIALVELLGILCLAKLAGPALAALYAWHPLAVIEVAGQGHTEGLVIGALGAFLLWVRKRGTIAAVALAVAGWVKLYPLALVLVLLRRWQSTVAFGVASALLLAPHASLSSVAHVVESLRLYYGVFDFYAAPYLALKTAIHPVLDAAAGGTAARALTTIWVFGSIVLVLTDDGTVASARRVTIAILIGYVFVSSTLHPWHLLLLLLVLPLLDSSKPLYTLVSLSPITYLAYVWAPGDEFALTLGWGGAALLGVLAARPRLQSFVMEARARIKWQRLRPFLPPIRPGGRLLDLGAGEGWVGALAVADRGLALTSVDVAEYGPRARGVDTVDLYDGQRLPYPDHHFDATLLVFVLHHAESPRRVLLEALRVTDGPVLIWETVHRSRAGKQWLERMDRWVNRIRSGGAIDEAALDIQSDDEWRDLFDEFGLSLEAVQKWGRLHPQAIYRLGHRATDSSTESADVVRASSHTASV